VGSSSHEIRLTANSKKEEYLRTWKTLCSLSIAEVDYQLRRYLILPGNLSRLLQMVAFALAESKQLNMVVSNIIVARLLDLAGSEICGEECQEKGSELLEKYRHMIELHEEPVERCMALSTHSS
jgi:hypothetical protein